MIHEEKETSKKIINGSRNVKFSDMVNLVKGFGFCLSRTEGSHHIFVHPNIPEQINLQEVKGEAKPYQVRQFVKLIEKHNLHLEKE